MPVMVAIGSLGSHTELVRGWSDRTRAAGRRIGRIAGFARGRIGKRVVGGSIGWP